ncbi:MAG TPA: aminomethyltransferase family protein, partial [Solirubrobacteraceae bacterium]
IIAPLAEGDISFGYFGAGELHVGPVPVRALRVSYVGELGWEFYAPTEFGGALWELLCAAGAEHGLVCCGVGAYDSLRLEKGYRLWGADIDEAHDPYEAGLGWAVKLDKGDFIGRGTAAERKERGPTRRLSCLTTDDPSVAPVGHEVLLDAERVLGWVTSAGWGASVGESIVYGYLPTELSAPGTRVQALVEGRREGLTVATEPLFDPAGERLRDRATAPAAA